MGKAGLLLSIIGLVLILITPIWVGGVYVAIPCVVVGIALSGVAFYQALKFGTRIDIPIFGWVISVIALVMIFVIFILAASEWRAAQ